MTEVLCILLGCAAVASIFWIISGIILSPIFDERTVTYYYGSGNGDSLECFCRSFAHFRTTGILVIVDCGLTANGLDTARLLEEKYPWITINSQDAP